MTILKEAHENFRLEYYTVQDMETSCLATFNIKKVCLKYHFFPSVRCQPLFS